MALEALTKESRYPSQGVIEEFAKLNNLDGATVKVWFNNMYLLTEWEGRTEKYLARGQDVRTERSEVRAS